MKLIKKVLSTEDISINSIIRLIIVGLYGFANSI